MAEHRTRRQATTVGSDTFRFLAGQIVTIITNYNSSAMMSMVGNDRLKNVPRTWRCPPYPCVLKEIPV